MVIQVNQESCDGCGICVGACSVGAIQLVDQRIVVDEALCTQCEVCTDACPNGAITTLSLPARSVPIAMLPAAESVKIPVPAQTVLPKTVAPAGGLAPLAGVALTFLWREIAPRLANVMIAALGRRLARPTTNAVALTSTPSRNLASQGRGEQRKQARYRGGHTGNRNHKERRGRICQEEMEQAQWVPAQELGAAGGIAFLPPASQAGYRPRQSRKPLT